MNNSDISKYLDDEIIGTEDTSNPTAKEGRPEDTQAPYKKTMYKPWESQIFHLPAGDIEEISEE